MDAHLASLPLATLQSRLTEADAALHALRVQKAAATGTGNRSTTFRAETEIQGLEKYVAALAAAIQAKTTGRPRRGPIYLNF
jgi:hypothetical protein